MKLKFTALTLFFIALLSADLIVVKVRAAETISQERYNKVCKWGILNPPECKKKIANINGWLVSGASKRGWTSWIVGAVTPTPDLPNVIAIAPLVPIVPDLIPEIHRQWKSYDGLPLHLQITLQLILHSF